MIKLVKTLIVPVVLLTASLNVSAQDWIGVNRDDNGKIVRGAYLTNEWFDNWYIGVSGGIFTSASSINNAVFTPMFDASILKWFTPSIGARFGYQGFIGKEYLTTWYNPYQINHSPLPFDGSLGGPGTLSYGFAYFHGDILWNITNAFWGYKYRRFYNLSVYANAGYVRLYDNTPGQGFGSQNKDNEFAFGAGLYNTFRITERLVATLDVRHFSTASRYKTSDGVRTHRFAASVGLGYNIYRTYWSRAQAILSENAAAKQDAAAAHNALKDANAEMAELEKKVAAKEAEIAAQNDAIKERDESLKKHEDMLKDGQYVVDRQIIDNSKDVVEVPYDVLMERANRADLIIYYYINVDKPNFSELHHLDAYVQEQLQKDPDHVFFLTGSADKGTGTEKRNTFLCRSRAYGIRDILINDYGVKESNVVIKSTVISDKHLDGALDRCVIIESE